MDLQVFYRVLTALLIVDIMHVIGLTYAIANDPMFSKISLSWICDRVGRISLVCFIFQIISYVIVSAIFL